MNRYLLPAALAAVFYIVSCSHKTGEDRGSDIRFSHELTREERSAGRMTPEILWKFGRLGSFDLSPDGTEILYTVTDIDMKTEARRTNIFRIPSSGGDPVLVAEGGSSPRWFGDGRSIAFVKEGRLMVMTAEGSEMTTVEGLDNFESYSISPQGDKILFTRRVKLDETANEKYSLPNARVRIIDDLMYRHWNYWSDYSYSHIFVASFNGRKISGAKDIMEGQKYESPTAPFFDDSEIAWSPDGRYIAYTSKRMTGRDYARSTNTDIFLYELSSGKEINISEKNHGFDKYPVFSPDGSKIAFQSMARDGYESDLDRLFIYDIISGKAGRLNRSWDFDVENINWADNSTLYFTCAHLGTVQIFKTDINGGDIVKLTEGVHDLGPVMLRSGVLVSGLQSMSMAPEISAVDLSTGSVKQISFINKTIYESVKMGRTEERYIRTKDNEDLHMWIIYPPDFDPSEKYPALLYCKGGPQGPLSQSWSYRWNYQLMAAKGYIVIAPNRRGSSGFGQEWKEQISGDYGGKNIQDYLDATDAIAREAYVDKNRIGAVGASYGGTSVFYLAGMHGGRFNAFISHCGMFNFTSWYGSTEELWFADKDIEGPYWNLPKSYQYSPHLMAASWDTPILIIAGAQDYRIPYTQSMEAFTAAQLNNVPSRLLFFEDEGHWVIKPQNALIWQNEFFGWLDTYLQ
jgi:dipeptidyl aminopeptidase/acylaminoacyl peptidase